MKKLILIAGIATLAACSKPEPAPEAPVEAAAPATAQMEIDGKPMTGTFDISSADGKQTMVQTVNEDGTVVSVEGDKTTNGTWTSTGPGNFCITNEGEAQASCYTTTVAEDGVMTSTNDADSADVWTVKRVG